MTKTNIKRLLLFIVVFFVFGCKANASVIINEVQISPTDGRFIELYNSGDSSVDLTNWYIQRKTATGTFGSLVTKTNFEGKIINAGDYFVISRSSVSGSDIVIDNMTITESNTIQIKDSSGSVVDKVGWGETNDCSTPCPSNPTEGKSLQRVSGSWVVSSPTPDSINIDTSSSGNDTTTTSDTSTTTSSSSTSSSSSSASSTPKVEPEVYKPTTKIISPKVVTAEVPFTIDHQTTGTRKEKIILGKFVWNFGDGMTQEGSSSPSFSYVYQYEGEYVLTLSYYESIFDIKPTMTDRMTIKVIPSGINISSVGTQSDPFIEIENKSNYEMVLRDWILKGSTHSFIIPEGIVILPNKKLKLSPKITKFDASDLTSISIIDLSGVVFATYPKLNYPEIISRARSSSIKNINSENIKSEVKSDVIDDSNVSQIINLNDLGASASSVSTFDKLGSNIYAWLGLAGIIIIGIVSVIFIRHKNSYPDYVEGELTAKDMTIIE